MTELNGALDGIGLQPLLTFLEGLHKTGTLAIEDDQWTGTLSLVDGQLVGAHFGKEDGLLALDAIVFALQHGRFRFTDGEGPDRNLGIEPTALTEHLASLSQEVAALGSAVPSLGAVPRMANSSDDSAVTIGRGAVRLLVQLDGRRSVAQYAAERGLLVTVRELAELIRLGLVSVDPPPVRAERAPETPAPSASAPRMEPAAPRTRPATTRAGRSFWQRDST